MSGLTIQAPDWFLVMLSAMCWVSIILVATNQVLTWRLKRLDLKIVTQLKEVATLTDQFAKKAEARDGQG